ncbi:MAG: DUF4340 domain-containing protein [Ignavibacteriales bacterium]|nr:DUF4340 domain-containing protein [Ignavibacteriales bacterium]
MLFAKLGNRLYILLAIVLVITVGGILLKYSGSEGSETGAGIPALDSTGINRIEMIPKGGCLVVFEKTGEEWLITLPGGSGKKVSAEGTKITSMISTIAELKVINLVSRKKEDLAGFGLDTGATSLKLFSGEQSEFELLIGKSEMLSPQEMGTYVKMVNADDVYLVSGFLDLMFNSDMTLYRQTQLTFGGSESWQEIDFKGNENFTLKRNVTDWVIEGKKVDSAKISEYLNQLTTLEARNFADDIDPAKLGVPKSHLKVKTVSGREFEISAYFSGTDTLITSSLGKGNIYRSTKEVPLYFKIFPGKRKLE